MYTIQFFFQKWTCKMFNFCPPVQFFVNQTHDWTNWKENRNLRSCVIVGPIFLSSKKSLVVAIFAPPPVLFFYPSYTKENVLLTKKLWLGWLSTIPPLFANEKDQWASAFHSNHPRPYGELQRTSKQLVATHKFRGFGKRLAQDRPAWTHKIQP